MGERKKLFAIIITFIIMLFSVTEIYGVDVNAVTAKTNTGSSTNVLYENEISNSEIVINSLSNEDSILFILDKSMANSKLAEFYDLLQQKGQDINVETCFTDDLSTLADDSEVKSKIVSAEQVFIVGIPMKTNRDYNKPYWLKYPELDNLMKLNSAKWYYVYTKNNVSLYDWGNLAKYNPTQLDKISATFPWLMMYTNGLFDKTKDLGLKKGNEKPSKIAGYGLAVYLQYVLNNNPCTDLSYSDLLKKMNLSSSNKTTNSKCEIARKYITKELTYKNKSLKSEIVDVQDDETIILSDTFKEDHFEVFYDLYVQDNGIYKLSQEADGNPICFSEGYDDMIYERVWDDDIWIHNNFKLKQNMKEDKYDIHSNIKKDSDGNYYILKYVNDINYILKYNKNKKLIKTLCINDLTRSICDGFYLLKKDQLLIQTFLPADNYSSDSTYSSAPILHDKLMLINMSTGKIIRKYDTGFNFGSIELYKEKIYLANTENDKILIINGTNGEVEKIINIEDFGIINEENKYTKDLRTDRRYYYSIYKNYIYFLKKSGIYKINIDDGSWSKIVGGSKYNYFSDDYQKGTDFIVKNDKEMYVLSVWFDEHCSTDLYKYYLK